MLNWLVLYVDGAIEEAEEMIRQVLMQLDDPAYATATCTAGKNYLDSILSEVYYLH